MAGWQDDPIATAPATGGWAKDPIAGAAPPPSAGDAAFAQGRKAGHDESGLLAGISQAAEQGTGGLQNYVSASARYLADRINGATKPDDFSTDLAYSRGRSQGEAEGHTTAATIGGTAGALLGGAAAGTALKGLAGGTGLVADAAKAVGPVKGQSVRNVLKSMALGGTAAGTQSVAQGQSPGEAALSAAGGAVAAPIVGKAVSATISRYSGSASDKAWLALANTLHESPDTIQKARDAFRLATGDDASAADVVDLHSRGQLRALAAKNPEIANAAIVARNATGAGFDADARGGSAAAIPQTPEGIRDLRDTVVTQTMNRQSSNGYKLKDTPVSDPNGLFTSPHVEVALSPDQNLADRLRNAAGVDQHGNSTFDPDDSVGQLKDRLASGNATIGDADRVRQALRNMQGFLMKDSPNSPKSKDLANEFGDIANKVEGLATKADKNYSVVTKGYRDYSDYADGMEHAMAGSGQFDKTGDRFKDAALGRDNGQDGYAHGAALRVRNEARAMIAPSSIRPADSGGAPADALSTMASIKTGGLSAISHILRSIPGTDRLPAAVQDVIAKQAFDPRTFPQAIANMRRAGARDEDIRRFSAAFGQSVAGNASNSVTGQRP